MKRLLLSVGLISGSFLAQSQIVWTEPAFPTVDDNITLYYDASQGNGDVEGIQPLYYHAGLITSESSGPGDWQNVVGQWGSDDPQFEMTYEEDEIHSFDYNGQTIAEFYGVTDEEVLELAFVFRNADGSLVGRMEDGGDIFFPISDGSFNSQLLSPSSNNVAIQSGETVDFEVIVSQNASITWTIDGMEVASGDDIMGLQFTFDETDTGSYDVTYSADNGSETIEETIVVVVISDPVSMDSPAGLQDGITYVDDNTVRLQIFAPQKENIFVVGDFNDWLIDLDYQMNLDSDNETFWIEIGGLTPGIEYRFQYHILPDVLRVPDAYSEKFLDPWNDQWINDSTYPDLIDFPTGMTTNTFVSILETGQEEFAWTDDDYERPPQDNLVIYELLVRDFSTQRTWDFLTDTISYLETLGVNAIEIMPFVEFPGNDSWGYNNALYFAPDKAYGTKESLQNFINECHERDIAVIMDVAFNHADLPNPFLSMYWDPSFGDWGAPSADNPWFNQEAPHFFQWFFDWNHLSVHTQDFVKRFMEFWIEEYHLDGWRWDFTQGFIQNPPAISDGIYSQERIDIMNIYGDHVWSIDPDIYMILEHWCENSEEVALANNGFMLWGNVTHDYQEAAMGWASNLNWANYQDRGYNDPHLVTYMESHDEERLMYKNLEYGNANGGYNIQDLNTALDRIELTSCFNVLLPGPKMIWQFGELGYDFSINHCPNGTINENCRTSAKPVKWDYRDDPNRYELYQVYAALNHLKTTEEAFRTTDFGFNGAGFEKTLHLNHSSMNVVVAGNFSVNNTSFAPWFPNNGVWYDYFTGVAFQVNDQNMMIDFEPGEYHVYTDVQLDTPEIVTHIDELTPTAEVIVYPNPFSDQLDVNLAGFVGKETTVELLDLNGRVVAELLDDVVALNHFNYTFEVGANIPQGMYLVRASNADGTSTAKVFKK